MPKTGTLGARRARCPMWTIVEPERRQASTRAPVPSTGESRNGLLIVF